MFGPLISRIYESLLIGSELQDKVNYVVSEREDRVTGATMLTRMAGCKKCTGLQLCCAELYWDVLGCTGLYWTVPSCIGL